MNFPLESFENAYLELFASYPLVANRHGSLYPGKVLSPWSPTSLKQFCNHEINFAELFACEVTFLHMSVNCKEEKLTVRRKKSHIYGQYIREENFAATLVSNFYVGLANYKFFLSSFKR